MKISVSVILLIILGLIHIFDGKEVEGEEIISTLYILGIYIADALDDIKREVKINNNK